MNYNNDFIKILEDFGLMKLIVQLFRNLIEVGLIGWGLVSFFTLSWGQALLISFLFNNLCNSIRYRVND